MKNRKKILCIIGQLGNGGTERQLQLFLKHLDKDIYDAQVLVSGKASGRWAEPISSMGVCIQELGNINAFNKLMKFRRIVSEFRPDIIFSWSFFTNAFSIACHRIPFIGSLRGDLNAAQRNIGRPMWRLSLWPKRFIVNSNLLKAQLEEVGIKRERISVVPNIFDAASLPSNANDRERIRKRYSIPQGAKVVCGAGRDIPEKNLGLFIRVFKTLRDSDSSIYGFLLGSCAATLQNKTREMGLTDFLFFPGEVNNPFEFLRASDVFFLSSRTEGMPNIAIEGLYCGCRIASMDVGGISDIAENNKNCDIKIFGQDSKENEIVSGIKKMIDSGKSSAESFNSKFYDPATVIKNYIQILEGI
ncbi:MAG TPA: glycosyltransferase [Victivallales bacterium]|nr:glycosyltransferase [Victivallales bacterium]